MNSEVIMTAARTVMSMCTDYPLRGLSEKMFVHNLSLYATKVKEEYEGK